MRELFTGSELLEASREVEAGRAALGLDELAGECGETEKGECSTQSPGTMCAEAWRRGGKPATASSGFLSHHPR